MSLRPTLAFYFSAVSYYSLKLCQTVFIHPFHVRIMQFAFRYFNMLLTVVMNVLVTPLMVIIMMMMMMMMMMMDLKEKRKRTREDNNHANITVVLLLLKRINI